MLCVAMLTLIFTSATAFPRKCSDGKPINLLGEAVGEKAMLPIGVEIVNIEGVKGYRFNSQAITFGVNSEKIFKICTTFPTEFSIQINYRHPAARNTYEHVLTLLAQDRRTVLLSIQLRKNTLLLEYISDPDRTLQSVRFKSDKLTDNEWHNLVISIADDEVKFTLDCEDDIQKSPRPISSKIDTRKTRFYVGSSRQKRNRFTGTLRQLILLPGSDASNLICPSPNPSLASVHERSAHGSRNSASKMPVIFQDEQPYITCSLRHKGRLLYSTDSTLKICNGDEFRNIKSNPIRMDYITDYEDIPINMTIDIEIFEIPGVAHFLASANRGNERNSKSTIYSWNGERFCFFQDVPSKSAQHWKYFNIGDEHFLALANSGTNGRSNVKSAIFRYSHKKEKFIRHQLILTYSARSWEYFTIDGNHYIAVANNVNDEKSRYNLSEIFVWEPGRRLFLPFQVLPSVGATDIEFFKVEIFSTFNFLAVANTYNDITSKLNSSIFLWLDGRFQLYQNIPTTGASDWEFFEINSHYYLVAANTFSIDTRISNDTKYDISSPIYELNLYSQKFEEIQDVITRGAMDWEFFTIGDNYYLIVSSFEQQKDQPYTNVIYKWQGLEKFVPIHNFTTGASTDFEHVTIAGEHYLAMAQPFRLTSKLFKIVTY